MKRSTLLLCALLAACGADRVSGTGSQTGNSVVAGRLFSSDSSALDNVHVHLRPAAWTVDSSRSQVRTMETDSLGRFRFDDLEPGLWRLESDYPSLSWARNVRLRPGQDSTLPPAYCRAPGTLVTEVHINDTLRTGTLVVLGTNISRSLYTADDEIHLTITGLPAGTNWIALRRQDGTLVRQASVVIVSGQTTVLGSASFTGEITGPEEHEIEDD
jgi:hypothetical protein